MLSTARGPGARKSQGALVIHHAPPTDKSRVRWKAGTPRGPPPCSVLVVKTDSARGRNIQSVLRFVASRVGDDVKTVVDTYLNGGYTSDDETEYDGALVDVAPRPGLCPTCRRPSAGRAVVRELRAVRA